MSEEKTDFEDPDRFTLGEPFPPISILIVGVLLFLGIVVYGVVQLIESL